MRALNNASDVIGFLRRQYPTLVICLAALAAAGGLYLSLTPTNYTASATMIIDPRKGQTFSRSVLGEAPIDSAWIDSQIGALNARREKIALSVVNDLHLASDPELVGDNEPTNALFGFVSNLLGAPNAPRAEDTRSESELVQQATGALASRLDVKRVGLSYLVTINFSSRKPEHAVKIVNAAADAYIAAERETKYQETLLASNWLRERYQALREQSSAAERATVEFKNKNKIITAGGKPISDQQLAEISGRLVAARARMAEMQARLSQIETVLGTDQSNGTAESTVSDTLNNPIITKLRIQYLDLSNREAAWAARYGAGHLAVVNLRNQKRDILNNIVDELRRIASTYRSDYEIAKKGRDELEKQLVEAVSQIPNDAQITLRGLESSAQSYRTFFDNFLLHHTEAVQEQSSPIRDMRVVALASNAFKSSPQTFRVIAITVLGGMAFGVGVGLLRENLDRRFRTTAEVESALRKDCIALVPLVRSDRYGGVSEPRRPANGDMPPLRLIRRGASAFRNVFDEFSYRFVEGIGAAKLQLHNESLALVSRERNNRQAVFSPDPSMERYAQKIVCDDASASWRVVNAPFSRFAEAVRAIKLAADMQGEGKARVIGMTSAVPREGKSTVATALAVLIAQVGARVILVDCDLRNPAVSLALTPRAVEGITTVLSGKCSLEEAIWRDPGTNLAFLPGPIGQRSANTNQILASDEMKSLFDRLRQSYDYIIVDLSPLAPVVDVRATTHLVDSYILVVEWGNTKIEVVEHALKEARHVGDKVLGVVLNKVDVNVLSRYQGDRADYYRNKHFAAYGYVD